MEVLNHRTDTTQVFAYPNGTLSMTSRAGQVRSVRRERNPVDSLVVRSNTSERTQLTTRARFFQQLTAAVDERPIGTVALLNIDLDDFKQVNDTYGNGAGDALLVEVAARMRGLGVPGALPARFGGDEFAMLLTGLSRPEDADLIAGRLCDELSDRSRWPARPSPWVPASVWLWLWLWLWLWPNPDRARVHENSVNRLLRSMRQYAAASVLL